MPLLIIQISITFIVLVSAVYFIWSAIFSIPYWPSDKKFMNNLKKVLPPGERIYVAELGAGDGRIAFALCKMGFMVDAFEINPLLTIFIRLKKILIRERRLNVFNQDFMKSKINFAKYQAVVMYLEPNLMELLESKLFYEMSDGSIIISNTFRFPNKKAENVYDKMLVYRVKRK